MLDLNELVVRVLLVPLVVPVPVVLVSVALVVLVSLNVLVAMEVVLARSRLVSWRKLSLAPSAGLQRSSVRRSDNSMTAA